MRISLRPGGGESQWGEFQEEPQNRRERPLNKIERRREGDKSAVDVASASPGRPGDNRRRKREGLKKKKRGRCREKCVREGQFKDKFG